MAQGILKKGKSSAPAKRKPVRKALSIAQAQKKRAIPQRPKKHRRDPEGTKLVNKNIEKLMAAKTLRNEGMHLRLSELKEIGKKQIKVEDVERAKKKRSKEDAQKHHIEIATKRLEKQ